MEQGEEKTISFQCTLFEIMKKYIYLLKVVKNSGHHLIHSIIFFSIFLIAESVSLSCSSGLKEFEIL